MHEDGDFLRQEVGAEETYDGPEPVAVQDYANSYPDDEGIYD